jgi:hypothetical protein
MVRALLLTSTAVLSCAQPTGLEVKPHPYSTLNSARVLATSEPTDTSPPTASSMVSPAERPSATGTHTPTRTQTAVPPLIYLPCLRKPPPTPTPEPTVPSVPSPTATPQTTPPVHPEAPALVLANYFPWYDPSTWETGCTSGDDRPRDGVYNSDDPHVISRHIDQARSAGLSGFAVHWFAPDDRTDRNLPKVLDRSPEGFNSTITFLYHILPGVNRQGVIDALRYIHGTYGGHPRFLRLVEKPVTFFSDMYRVPDVAGNRPASDQDVATAVAHWSEIRNEVDPGHTMWWIAEGLRPEYLEVFDGLFVYKIDHACCPNSYQKAPRWANSVRLWEQQTGRAKLWVGTVMPGWDDLNSAQATCVDLRVSSEQFARVRGDGAYYARTWEAVLPTAPDMVLVHSFNEWVEGSYVEPSNRFGDLYIPLTAQWVTLFRASR